MAEDEMVGWHHQPNGYGLLNYFLKFLSLFSN